MINHTIRAGRLVLGIVLIGAGAVLALPFVPGPGLVIVFVGLSLVGREFHWAHRLTESVRTTVRRLADRVSRNSGRDDG